MNKSIDPNQELLSLSTSNRLSIPINESRKGSNNNYEVMKFWWETNFNIVNQSKFCKKNRGDDGPVQEWSTFRFFWDQTKLHWPRGKIFLNYLNSLILQVFYISLALNNRNNRIVVFKFVSFPDVCERVRKSVREECTGIQKSYTFC